MIQKKFIYFPSLSAKYSILKKDDFKLGDIPTIRFYDDRFPEKYRHKYFLLTAASFYDKKNNTREALGLENSLVLADSGGFQIARGTMKYDINLVDRIMKWSEENSDLAMNLDIPPKLTYFGKFRECLDISLVNFKYYEDHQSGKTKFLNVIQADVDVSSYDVWYNKVKHFESFHGWGIGSTLLQHYNTIYIVALFLQHREFEKKNNLYYHFLGATNPFNQFLYAVIQKNLNKYYPHAVVTTDSSTPLYQTTYGNWYHSVDFKRMNYNTLYMGNKGKCAYTPQAKLPCTFEDCPVCSNISYDEIADYETNSILSTHMGWHNLFIFTKSIDWISDLVYGGYDTVQRLFPTEIVKIAKSIDEMFEKPEHAMRVYLTNSNFYKEVCKRLGTPTDKQALESTEASKLV